MSTTDKSSGGWLSSLGRIFTNPRTSPESTGSPVTNRSSSTSPIEKRAADAKHLLRGIASSSNGVSSPTSSGTPQATPLRSLRYLSPSSLETDANKEVPSRDIFAPTTSRKRAATSDVPSLFSQDTTKRTRVLVNQSVIEEPAKRTFTRLDTTWAGGESRSFLDASPSSSNRSLMSRFSAYSTTSSGLSSRTRAILQQLEKVSTPAKEARKLPVMRGSAVSERWAPLSTAMNESASNGPPLKRTTSSVPNRIQLLSSSQRRKPDYWRDLSRTFAKEKTVPEREQFSKASEQTNGSHNDASMVHELFDVSGIDSAVPSKSTKDVASTIPPKKHNSVLKGSDGKGVNVFNAKALEEEDNTWNALPKSLPLPTVPAKGFLDGLIFNFAPPKEKSALSSSPRITKPVQNVSSSESSDRSGDSSEDTSDNDSDDGSGTSGNESSENASVEKKEVSRPPTSADSETSAATPASSKEVSPMTGFTAKDVPTTDTTKKVESKSSAWDCQTCFITNKSGDTCLSCSTPREGGSGSTAPTKTLVSNIMSFGKQPSNTVSFGFGSGPKPSADGNNKDSSSKDKPLFGTSIKSVAPTAPVAVKEDTAKASEGSAPAATASDRVDWFCPDCAVQNKASQDACACCGHVMYKTAGAAPASVFGNNAFKATSAPSGFSFGFGSSAQSASSNEKPSTNNDLKSEDKKADASAPAASKPTEAVKPLGSGLNLLGGAAAVPAFGTLSGSKPSSTTTPVFGVSTTPADNSAKLAPISTSSTSAVTTVATNATPAPPSITGFASTGNLFGASAATTTSEPAKPALGGFMSGAAAPTKSLFGASLPAPQVDVPPSFGSALTSSFGIGSVAAAAPPVSTTNTFGMFGAGSTGVAPDAKKSLFGGPADSTETKKPLFGSLTATSSAPSLFPPTSVATATPSSSTNTALSSSGSGLFGNTNMPTAQGSALSGGFGAFGSVGSTNSVNSNPFAAAAPAQPTNSQFNFNAAPLEIPSTFAFGSNQAAPMAENTLIQFGAANVKPASSSGPLFMFGSSAAPSAAPPQPAASSAFSYNSAGGASTGARRMAAAKRRMGPRR